MKSTSVRLTDEDDAALQELAGNLKCFTPAGKPSWRLMLHLVAKGFLTVTREKVQSGPKPKAEKKEWKGYWKFRAKWWEPLEDSTMLASDAVKSSGMTLEQLKSGGLIAVDDNFLGVPDNWRGWKFKKTKVEGAA